MFTVWYHFPGEKPSYRHTLIYAISQDDARTIITGLYGVMQPIIIDLVQ